MEEIYTSAHNQTLYDEAVSVCRRDASIPCCYTVIVFILIDRDWKEWDMET